jgi:hypothetical protein
MKMKDIPWAIPEIGDEIAEGMERGGLVACHFDLTHFVPKDAGQFISDDFVVQRRILPPRNTSRVLSTDQGSLIFKWFAH